MTQISKLEQRWRRRYAGRRFIWGIPVQPEPYGAMVDAYLTWDIAVRQSVHAARKELLPLRRLVRRIG